MGSPYTELWRACDRQRRINKLEEELAELREDQDAFETLWIRAFGPILMLSPGNDRQLVEVNDLGVQLIDLPYAHHLPDAWPDATPAIDPDDAQAATAWTGQTIPAEAVTAGGGE